ncbi:ATPase GET3A-like protein [Drosera capensis]
MSGHRTRLDRSHRFVTTTIDQFARFQRIIFPEEDLKMGGEHGGHGTTYKGMTLHAPKRWHVVTGKGMCALMWFWVLYRAKQDGPVVLGWRHPWDGHGDHGHGHGHEIKSSPNPSSPKSIRGKQFQTHQKVPQIVSDFSDSGHGDLRSGIPRWNRAEHTRPRNASMGIRGRQSWSRQDDVQLHPSIKGSCIRSHHIHRSCSQSQRRLPAAVYEDAALVNGFSNLYAMEVDPTIEKEDIPGVDGSDSFMSLVFGAGDEFGEEAILGKLEGMKDLIEQRLVEELTKFEIDTRNILINQVLHDEEAIESKLLKARMRMQQKYIDQFYVLYDDFHITKLPLLPEESQNIG